MAFSSNEEFRGNSKSHKKIFVATMCNADLSTQPSLFRSRNMGSNDVLRDSRMQELPKVNLLDDGECSSPRSVINLTSVSDNCLTSHSRARRETRRVSIDDRVGVQVTIPRDDISPEEYNATWYSHEEYGTISQSCCKQISKLNRGELLKDKKYCARGLESHTHTQSLAKRMNRSLAYQAVLEEQDRQYREGILNDDALACIYHAANSGCQLWANVVGLDDQKEADIIHDDLEETLLSHL